MQGSRICDKGPKIPPHVDSPSVRPPSDTAQRYDVADGPSTSGGVSSTDSASTMIDELVKATAAGEWEMARELLLSHWARDAPKVFAPNAASPWEYSSDEKAIASTFLAPIAMVYCGVAEEAAGSEGSSLDSLNEMTGTKSGARRAGQVCGHVFREGEPTFSCRECASDPTCVLCHECFSLSIHKNHKYKMHTSGGSGYCDCGDPEAWREGYACTIHAPDQSGPSVPPTFPSLDEQRLRGLTSILLDFAVRVVTWPKNQPILDLFPEMRAHLDASRAHQTILYNDETHTYDSVIRALELSVNCTREQAMLLATFVDKEGRASVSTASKEACERVSAEIKRRTGRDHNRRTEKTGPLEVQVLESELVSAQQLAVALMQWLTAQLSSVPALAQLVGSLLLEPYDIDTRAAHLRTLSAREEDAMEVDAENAVLRHAILPATRRRPPGDEMNISELVMHTDRQLWKQARTAWHQLFMRTVLMDTSQKIAFSKKFMSMYQSIWTSFIDDDQEHEASIVSLSVQMLTVPPIARILIAEDSALAVIFRSFYAHCEKYIVPEGDERAEANAAGPVALVGRFDFTGKTFPATLKRALQMLRDQAYLLTQIPSASEWTDLLRDSFVEAWRELIRFLTHMQGMDEVKRQQGDHQMWEQEWETAFNMQLRLQETINLMLAWARSDKSVHRRVLAAVLEATENLPMTPTGVEMMPMTHDLVRIAGLHYAVPYYDLLKYPVSIHQPLTRLLAGLMTVPEDFNSYLVDDATASADERLLAEKIKSRGSELWEMQIRVLVLCAQAQAQLWRRNGYSLINQVHNYFSPLCRIEMFDQDLAMLQVGAALSNPDNFLLHIMYRFKVHNWADPAFEGPQKIHGNNRDQDEMSKVVVVIAEEFLTLLINIISERHRAGVGACTSEQIVERELIHILAAGPLPFSQIHPRMHFEPSNSRINLQDAVGKVAVFKRVQASAGKFELREENLDKYDVFFYHYSRQNASAAEQHQRRLREKKDRATRACPPPPPIPFLPFFSPIRRILLSPVLVRVLTTTLDRTARRNRFASENLLHRALHLTGLALHEQLLAPLLFDFISVAAQDEYRLLERMEDLASSPEGAAHTDLLWWTITKFKEVEAAKAAAERRGVGGVERTQENMEVDREERLADDEAEKRKKAKATMAARMREKALKQIEKMQKKFIEKQEDEEPKKDDAMEGTEADSESNSAAKEDSKRREENYDEDDDCPIIDSPGYPSSFPICIGPHAHSVEKVNARLVTCCLCQEQEPLETSSHRFVVAALVQRSQLFTQRVSSAELRLESFLVNAALDGEKETSTCSHTMHYSCYQNMYDVAVARERNRARQVLHSQRILDAEAGEYLCPVCKRYSNTALPLLPALQTTAVAGFSEQRSPPEDETFESWLKEIRRFVALTKPKHSRKRSHSERSLADLTRQAERTHDPIAQGSLETGLSTSVPSASQINLLLEETRALGVLPPPLVDDEDRDQPVDDDGVEGGYEMEDDEAIPAPPPRPGALADAYARLHAARQRVREARARVMENAVPRPGGGALEVDPEALAAMNEAFAREREIAQEIDGAEGRRVPVPEPVAPVPPAPEDEALPPRLELNLQAELERGLVPPREAAPPPPPLPAAPPAPAQPQNIEVIREQLQGMPPAVRIRAAMNYINPAEVDIAEVVAANGPDRELWQLMQNAVAALVADAVDAAGNIELPLNPPGRNAPREERDRDAILRALVDAGPDVQIQFWPADRRAALPAERGGRPRPGQPPPAAGGAPAPPARLPGAVAPRIRAPGAVVQRQNDIADSLQRHIHAIPSYISNLINSIPQAFRDRLMRKFVPPSVSQFNEPVKDFTKHLMKLYTVGDAASLPSDSLSATVAVWRTTAQVVRSVAANLEVENKPLFGALNTRQRDCIYALARVSALLSCNIAPLGDLIRIMLRLLLHPTVANPYSTPSRSGIVPLLTSAVASATSPSTSSVNAAGLGAADHLNSRSSSLTDAGAPPMSPPPVYNCQPTPRPPPREKDAKKGRAAAAAIALFFSGEKKETTFNILHIDILSLTVELMMCIGWTWNDGSRTTKCPQNKEMVPDGSADELYVMRLGLIAYYFQTLATFVDCADADMEGLEAAGGEEEEGLEERIADLWKKTRPEGTPVKDAKGLVKAFRSATLSFLRPLALLYHSLRLVPPPEALRDPSVDEFDPLCRFLGLSSSLKVVLSSPAVDELFAMWSPCIPEDAVSIARQPAGPRQLVTLPHDFADLITLAARFRCPTIAMDEKSTQPTMCLLCGTILCSQSYCCQKTINKESVGACVQHLAVCSGPIGLFLRIRDCTIVLLTNRLRGCIRPAPYVDEWGETDQGFRRGNPLHLNEMMYGRLRHMWMHQGVAEEVINRYEMDHRNMAYEWNHF